MSNRYLENREEMKEGYLNPETGKRGKAFEEPAHIIKAFKNCKTKIRHSISKIIIEGTAPDNITKEILEWSKDSAPIVVYKGGK